MGVISAGLCVAGSIQMRVGEERGQAGQVCNPAVEALPRTVARAPISRIFLDRPGSVDGSSGGWTGGWSWSGQAGDAEIRHENKNGHRFR